MYFIENVRERELAPTKRQKSFYGKAKIIYTAYGVAYLKSYNTIICCIRDGHVFKVSNAWSTTTSRHIGSFLETFNLHDMGKKEWGNLPCYIPMDWDKAIFNDCYSGDVYNYGGGCCYLTMEERNEYRRAR